jgi:predicted transcriptional regulator
MARTPRDVTEAELAVMQVLWEEGHATIRRLTDVLYPGGGRAHYATVQKLLERLEAGEPPFVRRERHGGVNVFRPSVRRDELIGRRLQSVAEQLCGGSWTPLLTTLVQQRRLSASERQQLRDLIDDLDQPAEPKKGRKKS